MRSHPRVTRYRFSGFELNLAAYELSHAGRQIRLEKIPFDLLTLLLERHGEVVTRDEIAAKIWSGTAMVDIENGINTAIRKLRVALDDDPQNPRFIQTAVGRGYRFVHAGVEAIPGEGPVAPPLSANRGRWMWALGTVLAVAAGGFWFARDRLGSSEGPVMIAVLPFTNLNPDPAENYFAVGVTADIITQLGRSGAEQVGVIAHTSVLRFTNTKTPVRQIAKQLGVEFVLEGSVRREGHTVRIGAQLIRVRDESHVWAKNYDRESKSILAIQSEVAGEVAGEIRRRIVRTPSPINHQVVPAAYDLYLQGRFHLNRRTEEDLKKAIGYFEAAISSDATYAAAHAGLADSYSALGYLNYLAPTEAFAKARIAARQALDLDPSSAQARAALGYIEMYSDWDFNAAERSLQKSIEIDPSYAAAHEWLGILLTAQQKFDAAEKELRQASRLDPLSPGVLTNLAFAMHYGGQNQDALQTLESALRLNPGFPLAQFWMGRVYGAMGRCPEAMAALAAGSPSLSAWQPMLAAKGYLYGECGTRPEAEKILADLQMLAKTRFVTSYGVALVYAGLGRNEDVLMWLRKAFDERSHWLVWLKLDPRWKRVRHDSRFVELENEVFRHL